MDEFKVEDKVKKQIAKYLLEIGAVKLQLDNPFTWTSGWKSPIYCDNRKTLSFPEVRTYIKEQFVKIIEHRYQNVELIAGVATGAIAQAGLVAQELNLPMVYVRQKQKSHGLENLIEGIVKAQQKTIVIEDLISTGKSSLNTVYALRQAGCNVLALLAIFSYNFNVSTEGFKKANCQYLTLCDYDTIIELALETNYIGSSDVEILKQWRKTPQTWGK